MVHQFKKREGMMMMTNTNQLSAVEQIKQEFMERWGVDVNISLSVHTLDNPKLTEEKAKEIVSAFTPNPYSDSHENTYWVNNQGWIKNHGERRPNVEVSVFYTPTPKGWEEVEGD